MRTSDFLISSLHRMLTEHMKEGLYVCQHISSHEFYVTDGEFCQCDLHLLYMKHKSYFIIFLRSNLSNRVVHNIQQQCTNPGYQVTMTANLCIVAPDLGESSVWNLHHSTLWAPRILQWLLEF